MSMADKVVKQFPGASRLGDFFGFLGGVLNVCLSISNVAHADNNLDR